MNPPPGYGQDSIRPGRLLPMAAPTLTVGRAERQ
jgi:hypothetical protein